MRRVCVFVVPAARKSSVLLCFRLRYCLSLVCRFCVEENTCVPVCGKRVCVCVCVCVCECLECLRRKPCEYELQSEYRSVSQRLSEMAAVISPNYTQISPWPTTHSCHWSSHRVCVCVCVCVCQREEFGDRRCKCMHSQLACSNQTKET